MVLKSFAHKVLPDSLIRFYKDTRYKVMFGNLDRRGVFTKIYNENIWSNSESVSGSGSTVAVTEVLRGELKTWLAENAISSFVDIPCGDFNWMRLVEFPAGMTYTGMDIVQDIVDKNNELYASDKIKFVFSDLLESDLPKSDVYFCKDIFIHFPNDAIAQAVVRLRESARFILATTFPGTEITRDIKFGDARRVNMEEFLGPPQTLLKDYGGGVTDRYIGVWKVA